MTANRIAHIRKFRGLTQAQLADKLGLHWMTVSRIERGMVRLTAERKAMFAAALKVKPGDLLVKGKRS